MPRGKETDQAPPGYMTPQEAAELLGFSDQTIRNQIKSKRLPGRELVHENGEVRYYASKVAVESILARRERNGDADLEHGLVLEEVASAYTSELVRLLDVATVERELLRRNQEKLIESTSTIAHHLQTAAEIHAQTLELEQDRERRRNSWGAKVYRAVILGAIFIVYALLVLHMLFTWDGGLL